MSFSLKFTLVILFVSNTLKSQVFNISNLSEIPNTQIEQDPITKKKGAYKLSNHQMLLPKIYKEISPMGNSNRYLQINKNDSLGVFDVIAKKIIVPPIYKFIDIYNGHDIYTIYKRGSEPFYCKVTLFKNNQKLVGLADSSGLIVPAMYENITILKGSNKFDVYFELIKTDREHKKDLYSVNQHKTLSLNVNQVFKANYGVNKTRFIIIDNNKYGVLDSALNWVIKPDYSKIEVRSKLEKNQNELVFLITLKNGRRTFTDYLNPVLYDDMPSYDYIEGFYNCIIVKDEKENKGVVDYDHKVIIPTIYMQINVLSDYGFLVQNESRVGYCNASGKLIFEPKYLNVEFVNNNYKSKYVKLFITSDLFNLGNVITGKIDPRKFEYFSDSPNQYYISVKQNQTILFLDSNLVIKKKKPIEEIMQVEMYPDEEAKTERGSYDSYENVGDSEPPIVQQNQTKSSGRGNEGNGDSPKMQDETRPQYEVDHRYKFHVVEDFKGFKGIKNLIGKELVEQKYSLLNGQNYDKANCPFFIFKRDSVMGILDARTGKELFYSTKYEEIIISEYKYFKDKLQHYYFKIREKKAIITDPDKHAIADSTGVLTGFLYSHLVIEHHTPWAILLNSQTNLKDIYNLETHKFIYKEVELFKNSGTYKTAGYIIKINDLFGVVDINNKEILPIKYPLIDFNRTLLSNTHYNNYYVVKNKKNKYATFFFYESNNQNLSDFYDSIDVAASNYAVFKNNGYYGLIDMKNGNQLLNAKYSSIKVFKPFNNAEDFYVYTIKDKKHELYSSNLELLCTNNDTIVCMLPQLCAVKQQQNYVTYNVSKKEYGTKMFSNAFSLTNKRYLASVNDSLFIYNEGNASPQLVSTNFNKESTSIKPYQNSTILISEFVKALENPNTDELKQWCANVVQVKSLNKLLDKRGISNSLYSRIKGYHNANVFENDVYDLYNVYKLLHTALHNAHGNKLEIKNITDLNRYEMREVYSKSESDLLIYNVLSITFEVNEHLYQYKLGAVFQELGRLFVYPMEQMSY